MDSGTIAQQLQAYNAKPVTSTDALNSALAQYGVPEIRNTVAGLRTTLANTTSALNNVDPSVTGRTSGSLVTEAQRQRQVANERAPIAEQLSSQTGALGTQQQSLQSALDQATRTANASVSDYNSGRQALQGQYDIAYKREQDAASAQAAQQAAQQRQSNEDRNYNLTATNDARNYNLAVNKAARSGANSAANDAAKLAAQYKVAKFGSGNYNFSGPNNAPVTLAGYLNGTGGGVNELKTLLANGSSYDKSIYKQIAKLNDPNQINTAIAKLDKHNFYGFQ